MKLSQDQLRAIGAPRRALFEETMIAHVQRFWAPEERAMPEDEARRTVRMGIGRAARHGIESEYDIGRFIDLICVLGQDFGERPPWANILAEPSSARIRVDQLCRTALEVLREGRHEE